MDGVPGEDKTMTTTWIKTKGSIIKRALLTVFIYFTEIITTLLILKWTGFIDYLLK